MVIMVELPQTTRQVARQVGVGYWHLYTLMREEKVTSPQRDGSGRFAWLPGDVQRLRKELAEYVQNRWKRRRHLPTPAACTAKGATT